MGRSFAAPSDRKPVAALMEALALPAGSAAHPAAGDVASSASSTCRRPQQAAVVHDEGARTEPALDGLAGLEVVPGLSGGREASRSTDDVTRRRWSCVVAAVNDGGKQAPAAHVSECPGGAPLLTNTRSVHVTSHQARQARFTWASCVRTQNVVAFFLRIRPDRACYGVSCT